MSIDVEATADPRAVLAVADAFLASEPVRHNLVATLLHRCAAAGGDGYFWLARRRRTIVGIAFQWPLGFTVALTPMPDDAVEAVVDSVVAEGAALAGVNGEAPTAARFAGCWTERTRCAARPVEGLRLYEVDTVVRPARAVAGRCRTASRSDADLLVAWTEAFADEVGESLTLPAAAMVDYRTAAGQLWLWECGAEPVAFLGLSAEVNGAVRVGPVYTPPGDRGHGYASALTADRSAQVRATGHRCLLYADLANPTSNGVYRAIGYRAVAETLRYEFDPRP